MDLNFGVKKTLWIDPQQSIWSSDLKEMGVLQLDTNFEPAKRENQYRMLEICKELEESTENLVSIDCPIKSFKNYLQY